MVKLMTRKTKLGLFKLNNISLILSCILKDINQKLKDNVAMERRDKILKLFNDLYKMPLRPKKKNRKLRTIGNKLKTRIRKRSTSSRYKKKYKKNVYEDRRLKLVRFNRRSSRTRQFIYYFKKKNMNSYKSRHNKIYVAKRKKRMKRKTKSYERFKLLLKGVLIRTKNFIVHGRWYKLKSYICYILKRLDKRLKKLRNKRIYLLKAWYHNSAAEYLAELRRGRIKQLRLKKKKKRPQEEKKEEPYKLYLNLLRTRRNAHFYFSDIKKKDFINFSTGQVSYQTRKAILMKFKIKRYLSFCFIFVIFFIKPILKVRKFRLLNIYNKDEAKVDFKISKKLLYKRKFLTKCDSRKRYDINNTRRSGVKRLYLLYIFFEKYICRVRQSVSRIYIKANLRKRLVNRLIVKIYMWKLLLRKRIKGNIYRMLPMLWIIILTKVFRVFYRFSIKKQYLSHKYMKLKKKYYEIPSKSIKGFKNKRQNKQKKYGSYN
jgi:hypothetical protein